MKLLALLPASCALLACSLLTGCGKTTHIIVGSKTTTEQRILAEIAAQQLERRLGASVKVDRRFSLGGTPILHQALTSGSVDLYPDDTGLVVSQILHETPDPDTLVTFTRTKSEMARVHLLDVLDPLGFDNRTVIVIPASQPAEIRKLSQAGDAPGKPSALKWSLGSASDFLTLEGGMIALNGYHLSLGAAPRAVKPEELFDAMIKGELNMVATQSSSAHLLSSDWRVLEDDLKVFPPRQTVFILRQELSQKEPRVKAILGELTGKIDISAIRKMTAQVELEQKTVAAVATQFLDAAGIK